MTKAEKLEAIGDAISHRQSTKALAQAMMFPITRGKVHQPCHECGRYRGKSKDECDDVEPMKCWRPKGAMLVWHEVEA